MSGRHRFSYLRLIVPGYQGDLRRFGDHVRGEMNHHVNLPRILPRGDAGLMDKYQRVQGSVVAGLLRDGHIHYSVEDDETRDGVDDFDV